MPLDRSQLDTLIGSLESGADALARATDVNTTAQTAAAKAQSDLDAAQKANTANVAALKSFVSALDPDGNDPAAVANPTPTPAGGTPTGATPPVPGDSGTSAASGGDGATVAPPAPAEGPTATGTAPATAPDQPTA